MTRIKICGITNADDALAAVEAGADALGFVFADSPRRVSPVIAREIVRSLPPFVVTVGVFMDHRAADVEHTVSVAGVSVVQFHGRESPDYCRSASRPVIKRIDIAENGTLEALSAVVRGYPVSGLLLDPGTGSGRAFDWRAVGGLTAGLRAEGIRRKPSIVIAGGLTPENVGDAIRDVRPGAVDVCTGVERSRGRKEGQKMIDFVHAVREADAVHVA